MTFEERNNEILQQNVADFNTNLRKFFKKFDNFAYNLGFDGEISSITMNNFGYFDINYEIDSNKKVIHVSTNLVKQFFNECFGTNKQISTEDLLEIREMYLKMLNYIDGIIVIDDDGTVCALDKDGDTLDSHFIEDIYKYYEEKRDKYREERYTQYLELKKEFEQTL